MILLDVKDFIALHRRVSVYQIAQQFDMNAGAAADILEQLARRRWIEKAACDNGCGTACSGCKPVLDEVYTWIERQS